jgi:hypothetical protein
MTEAHTESPLIAPLRRLLWGVAVAALFVTTRVELIASICCATCGGQPLCCDAPSNCACSATDGKGCGIFCSDGSGGSQFCS